ncbi:unnamed protein product [Allacma fusca]|uniref:C2H2-type domain-containing protein n=1 Tax=Allacma fusca TaxID=39272 RepID=A0A8J2K3Q3_9HEXA|nr:unnamed protein product [Allacma fusca]
MVTAICLICCSPCDRQSDNGHFLDTSNEQKFLLSEEETKYSWSVFNTFCEQMHVSLQDQNVCHWDFSKEDLPFCISCKETVSYISELNKQLQNIQNEMNTAIGGLRSKIESSEDILKNSVETLESEIDSRIPSFRRLLINGDSPSTGSVADLEQEAQSVKRTRRSVANSLITYQEDSDSEDNDIADADEQVSGSESHNSDWSPPGGGGSDDDVKVIGSKPGKQSFSSRKKKRKNYSENSENESDSDEEYKPIKRTRNSENTSGNDGAPDESMEESKTKRSKHRHIKQLGPDSFEYSGYKFVQVPEGFKCSICPNKPFKTRHGIVNHVKHIHLDEKSGYYCQHCGKHCDSPSGLRTHETTHTDIRDCICCECGKGFKNTKNLKRHLKETHKIDLKFLCHKCNKRMKTSDELQAHLNTAHSKDNPMYCENCGRVFPSALKLKDHVESHKGEKYFRCYYCDTYFLRQDNLKDHFSKEHGVKT